MGKRGNPAKRWRKGVSGNPAGRPKGALGKATKELRELAKVYTHEALETLARIMRDKSEPAQARVSACKELLDRGHGRTPQAIDVAVSGFDPLKYLARDE